MKAENLNFTVSDERSRAFLATQYLILPQHLFPSTPERFPQQKVIPMKRDIFNRRLLTRIERYSRLELWRVHVFQTGQRDFWRNLIRFVKIYGSVIVTSNQVEIQKGRESDTNVILGR